MMSVRFWKTVTFRVPCSCDHSYTCLGFIATLEESLGSLTSSPPSLFILGRQPPFSRVSCFLEL